MTFKVGDKVKSEMHNDTGVIQKIYNDAPDNQYGYEILFTCGNEWHIHNPTDLTPYIVPIGYTGKLKYMDLQEGDVVRHTKCNNDLYTLNNGYVGAVTIESSNDDYTLISRASETPKWSKWKMSNSSGGFNRVDGREYETNPLPDTDQVTYRWRDAAVKEPVVEEKTIQTHWDTTVGKMFYGPSYLDQDHTATITVTLHDGIPVSMSGEFTPKTATQS